MCSTPSVLSVQLRQQILELVRYILVDDGIVKLAQASCPFGSFFSVGTLRGTGSTLGGRNRDVFVLFGCHRREDKFLSLTELEIGSPGADVDPVNCGGTMRFGFGSLFDSPDLPFAPADARTL